VEQVGWGSLLPVGWFELPWEGTPSVSMDRSPETLLNGPQSHPLNQGNFLTVTDRVVVWEMKSECCHSHC